jgi:hypothetical protein
MFWWSVVSWFSGLFSPLFLWHLSPGPLVNYFLIVLQALRFPLPVFTVLKFTSEFSSFIILIFGIFDFSVLGALLCPGRSALWVLGIIASGFGWELQRIVGRSFPITLLSLLLCFLSCAIRICLFHCRSCRLLLLYALDIFCVRTLFRHSMEYMFHWIAFVACEGLSF